MKIDPQLFIDIWDNANSVTEASLILQKVGHARMTPRRTLEWARCLRAFGVRLKRIPRAPLPRLGDVGWLKVQVDSD
jgi:hypothetical protein